MKEVIYFFILLSTLWYRASSQTVSLRFIGEAPYMLHSFGSVQLNGSLYSLALGGQLYKLDLSTGEHKKLGHERFLYKRWFFAVNNQLFIIRTDGSMIGIDTATGGYQELFEVMSWRDISFVVPVGKKFYTVQYNTLYHHPTVHPKPAVQTGKPAFFQAKYLLLTDSTLHTPVGDCLYRVDLHSGEWTLVKKDKELLNYRTGAVIQNRFYYIQNSGAFVEINLHSGETKTLDKERFTRPLLFFHDLGRLYYLNDNGSLYEVIVEAPPKKGF